MRVTMCDPGRHQEALFHNHWEEALMSTLLPFTVDVENSNGRRGDMRMQIDQVCWITNASCLNLQALPNLLIWETLSGLLMLFMPL